MATKRPSPVSSKPTQSRKAPKALEASKAGKAGKAGKAPKTLQSSKTRKSEKAPPAPIGCKLPSAAERPAPWAEHEGHDVVAPRGALARVFEADPRLAAVASSLPPFAFKAGRAGSPLAALVRAVVYQQLSGKAASTIYSRLRALFPAGPFPSPEAIDAVPDEALRGVGLSRQKVGYIRDLCAHVRAGTLRVAELTHLPDDEIVQQVTRVKGFGRWSAEMFLLFHLGRLDVWPIHDFAVRKGWDRLRGASQAVTPKALDHAGEVFRPYRSIVAWYMWRLCDPGAEALLPSPEEASAKKRASKKSAA